MSHKELFFGKTLDGRVTRSFQYRNRYGYGFDVSNYGATITSLFVPDRHGYGRDVVLGFDSVSGYENHDGYAGAFCGRVTNRVQGAYLILNGTKYQLSKNLGDDQIHGGKGGFDKQIWEVHENNKGYTLSLNSPDGAEGYPGNLSVRVHYHFTDDNTLSMKITAESDADTVFNPTNHTYFNFELPDTILAHELTLNSAFHTDCRPRGFPVGSVLPVDGPLDLRTKKILSEVIADKDNQITSFGGLDHNFVLDRRERGELTNAATLVSPKNGIRMDVFTTMPSLQVYTGNHISNWLGKDQTMYNQHHGIAMETQFFPDAMRLTHFPSPVLRRYEQFHAVTEYRFSIES